ncbi:hypothetical protein GCWU000182_00196 [Abiotrophia defectiva ATCC 49176]|uniref:Uncharacterized protein n=1 Tax=Abiotrophia defectiva ATCC 49176 TaxID=592010 RepID=W1Q5N7_ABIDE|nr:hypothetical protein GCWU000182_00196 [Abiotrophia defectiva ATCC 49176]
MVNAPLFISYFYYNKEMGAVSNKNSKLSYKFLSDWEIFDL